MRWSWTFVAVGTLAGTLACGGGSAGSGGGGGGNGGGGGGGTGAAYVLLAWSELGMHCMDGKDYSVFSVLPPYNTIHAQLLRRGDPPVAVTTGVTITYQAVADARGSINTSSSDKTNFWTYVNVLFHKNALAEMGLGDFSTQSQTPHAMTYKAQEGFWEALGVPTVPYDDSGASNAYPMAQIVAKDSGGNVLATASIVLAVSDEMSCRNCHASGSNAAAMPGGGWENNSDPAKDVKLNILRKHDERWPINQYLATLQTNGYTYQASLYQTAVSGTPILCAACHGSNALSAPGLTGIRPLTTDMHSLHAGVTNPTTGTTLDQATTSAGSCYLCHPGANTRCQRGAMNATNCFDCHGNLTKVGDAARQGWLDVPACQMCHNTSQRFASTFAGAQWRTTTDLTFATNPNVPISGKQLYRYSSGHGSVFCSACHGSPHAEFPTLQANDNVYSTALQGYIGKITECTVCHANAAVSATGGPHGIHTVGQAWVDRHGDSAEGNGRQACAYCHGSDFRGSALSQARVQRTFSVEGGSKTFSAGHSFSCYDCHNGPNGG